VRQVAGTWRKGIEYRRSSGAQVSFLLTRLTSRRGLGNLHKFSGFHLVDIAVYRNVIGNQGVVSDARDILHDALGVIRECQPIDVAAFFISSPPARVAPATLVQRRGLQA